MLFNSLNIPPAKQEITCKIGSNSNQQNILMNKVMKEALPVSRTSTVGHLRKFWLICTHEALLIEVTLNACDVAFLFVTRRQRDSLFQSRSRSFLNKNLSWSWDLPVWPHVGLSLKSYFYKLTESIGISATWTKGDHNDLQVHDKDKTYMLLTQLRSRMKTNASARKTSHMFTNTPPPLPLLFSPLSSSIPAAGQGNSWQSDFNLNDWITLPGISNGWYEKSNPDGAHFPSQTQTHAYTHNYT